MTLSITSKNNSHLIVDEKSASALGLQPQLNWFDAHFWQQQNAVVGSATGRGTTYFVKQGEHTLVLRHYRRGGLIQRISEDKFVFTGIEKTRPWQELQLLSYMQERHLPVPVGIGGRVLRSGIHYQADVLIGRIADASDVHTWLCEASLPTAQWRRVGRTVRKLHDAQVDHTDLNIHNILRDARQQIWVIDFDKCRQRSGNAWKQSNLERLKRSLDKENQRMPTYHFSSDNWRDFVYGYEQPSTE